MAQSVYRALAARIPVAWLSDHELVVEHRIDGPRGGHWFAVVSDGRLSLRDELPDGHAEPDATVSAGDVAWAHVLSGETAPGGEKVTLRGDRVALALIAQWTERARAR
jgi:hypothetical protein